MTTTSTTEPTLLAGGPVGSEPPTPPGAAAELLATDGRPRQALARIAAGLGLSGIYGLALGARDGADALWSHAMGVPTALAAIVLIGVPALAIVLALFDAPLTPKQLLTVSAGASGATGLVLAGLAPVTALYMVTSEGDGVAAVIASIGLLVGGGLGLRALLRGIAARLGETDSATRTMVRLLCGGFALFAAAFAARLWSSTLPVLGGAS